MLCSFTEERSLSGFFALGAKSHVKSFYINRIAGQCAGGGGLRAAAAANNAAHRRQTPLLPVEKSIGMTAVILNPIE